jgi:hypothetical protein
MARHDLSYAEAWRRLAPTAARIGEPRPSYPSVRRIYASERHAYEARRERRAKRTAEALAGLIPRS